MKEFVTLLALVVLVAPASRADTARPWVRDGQLTGPAREVLAALRHVEDYGLDREDFAPLVSAIDAEPRRPADPKRLNDLMDAAALRFIRQLHDGRIDPRSAGYGLRRQRATLDADLALRRVAGARNALEVLTTFEPRSAQYHALKQALARYRRIPGGLSVLPPPGVAVLRVGDPYAGAANLRRRLAEFGDAPASLGDGAAEPLYDEQLAAAVARLQQRHGLAADGVLGPRTFAALAVPLATRIRQIELTMERWRWIPDIDPPAVIVNVPQYMLYTLPDPADPASGSRAYRIPVIVGATARQTPIFDSAIESVIFRPYWNVPGSILRAELLPLIARDPGYLERHDMEIVHGDGDDAQVLPANAASIAALRAGGARLRQRPGPRNALGLIKFVLPNPYSVYLHSTPEAQLFTRERRALSHGCIRVSDAAALAAYLLRNTPGDWNADAIEAATCADRTVTVRLASPVPVFILYGTVVIDADGAVSFFDDVYGYDRKLDALLSRPR